MEITNVVIWGEGLGYLELLISYVPYFLFISPFIPWLRLEYIIMAITPPNGHAKFIHGLIIQENTCKLTHKVFEGFFLY